MHTDCADELLLSDGDSASVGDNGVLVLLASGESTLPWAAVC